MINTAFWSKDYELSVAQSQILYPRSVALTLSIADDYLNNQFAFRDDWEMERDEILRYLPSPIDWNHSPTDDPERTFALNRHNGFVILGKAWRYTNNPIYVEKFRQLLTDWLENVHLNEENKQTSWRSIEAGIRVKNWLRALDLFSNFPLESSFLEVVHESLKVHGKYLEDTYTQFHQLSNWGIIQNSGLFFIGLAVGDSNWCSLAVNRLTEALHMQFCSDGTHWEQSPFYHAAVLQCYLHTILAGRRNDYFFAPEFLAQVQKASHTLAALLLPNGNLTLQSDSDELDARHIIALAAYLFEDSQLKAYAGSAPLPENFWEFSDDMGKYNELPMGSKKGSVALVDSGNFMLWDGTDQDSGFLHLHNGMLGSGHGHGDLLHIDLYTREETILTDSGRYTYMETPLRLQLKSPSAHNTVLIDDTDFSIPKDSWSFKALATPLSNRHFFSPCVDYLEASHLGYLDRGMVLSRQVLRLGKDLWVLLDLPQTTTEAKHQCKRFFHFGAPSKVHLQDGAAYFKGQQSTALLHFPNQNTQLSLAPAPLCRHYNTLEETVCLTVENSSIGAGLFTIITLGDKENLLELTASILPVTMVISKEELPETVAQGLSIVHGEKEWTLLFVHRETVSHVDYFAVGNYSGYGKVLVFSDNYPNGLPVKW